MVVLPLVPVTASQGVRPAQGPGAARPARPRPRPGHHAAGLGEQRRGRLPAGRDDEQVGVVGQGRRRAGAEPDVGAEDAEQLGLLLVAVGLLVECDHRGPEVEEVVGGREAADAEAGDHRPGPDQSSWRPSAVDRRRSRARATQAA